MYHDTFDFKYNPEGDYYDLVVDKKIQKLVDELCELPHDQLIRHLTYWCDLIDSRKYVVESDLPHEEWYDDCCNYAASANDEERYRKAKSMAQTLGHMLQDIKCNHPNKYPAAMRRVRSWTKYRFIVFSPTMREEMDRRWVEPKVWEDGRAAVQALVPLLETFMKQYEEGRMAEAAGNAFYLMERLCRLYCKDFSYFEPNKDDESSHYELLFDGICHILSMVMKDKRTEKSFSISMSWHLCSINMLYGQILMSSLVSYQELMYGEATKDTFAYEYEYLVKGLS